MQGYGRAEPISNVGAMFRKVPQAGIGITTHGVPADRPMGEVPSAPPTPVGIPILAANSVAFIGEVVFVSLTNPKTENRK